jgi:formylglycine-generating enzyme required for sulfatase activity
MNQWLKGRLGLSWLMAISGVLMGLKAEGKALLKPTLHATDGVNYLLLRRGEYLERYECNPQMLSPSPEQCDKLVKVKAKEAYAAFDEFVTRGLSELEARRKDAVSTIEQIGAQLDLIFNKAPVEEVDERDEVRSAKDLLDAEVARLVREETDYKELLTQLRAMNEELERRHQDDLFAQYLALQGRVSKTGQEVDKQQIKVEKAKMALMKAYESVFDGDDLKLKLLRAQRKNASDAYIGIVSAHETALLNLALGHRFIELVEDQFMFEVLLDQLNTELYPWVTITWFVSEEYVTLSQASALFEEVLGLKFVSIPAGTFMMGSPATESGRWDHEGPQHQVTISKGFELQATEVTQGQWVAVMGSNPSNFQSPEHCPGEHVESGGLRMCPNNPVEQVSWDMAQEFIQKLNSRGDGYRYRLPTEAEWEYAARAGTTGPYAGDVDAMAWYELNSGDMTHPVAKKQANAWGLYDMHGNVWEWTADWFGSYRSGAVTDPTGPSTGSIRVYRGGSWSYGAQYCRSAYRNDLSPLFHDDGFLGFRLLRTNP